jgi:hypothetical protein
MTTRALLSAVLGILSSAAMLDAAAHHSWAMYDSDRTITVSGVVTRVEWTSPHVFFYFEAADENGDIVEWTAEMDPPVLLRRYGLLPDMIKPGTRVTPTGVHAKTGAPVMRAVFIELEDGTKVRVSSRV